MNLPFLRQKDKAPSISAPIVMSDGSQGEREEVDSGLMEAARDIIKALEMKDARRLADAIRAAFQICDSMPAEEASQSDEDQQP